jgi:hypothetical protein
MTAPSPKKTPAARSSRFYLPILLGTVALYLPGMLALGGTDWFFHHDNYFSLRNIGYSKTLRHADCQVLLTGDSSALTGLDQQAVSRITGMSACNVAEGGTITAVTGPVPLETYLRQNKPPRYLVFMFTPSLYKPAKTWGDYGSYVEGIVYLLRYQRNREAVRALATHPKETISFAAWVGRSVGEDAIRRLLDPHRYDGMEDPAARRRRFNGLFTYDEPPQTRCVRDGDVSIQVTTDPEWVEMLRRKYGVNGTRVIVNVAPIPECSVGAEAYERGLRGVHDNAMEKLPVGMFNNGDVHFTPEGAAHLSTELGHQILRMESAGQ